MRRMNIRPPSENTNFIQALFTGLLLVANWPQNMKNAAKMIGGQSRCHVPGGQRLSVRTNTAMGLFSTRMTYAVVSIWSIVYFQSVETLRYQESAIARLYSRERKREFSKERNIQRFANSLLQSHSRLEKKPIDWILITAQFVFTSNIIPDDRH